MKPVLFLATRRLEITEAGGRSTHTHTHRSAWRSICRHVPKREARAPLVKIDPSICCGRRSQTCRVQLLGLQPRQNDQVSGTAAMERVLQYELLIASLQYDSLLPARFPSPAFLLPCVTTTYYILHVSVQEFTPLGGEVLTSVILRIQCFQKPPSS